MVVTIPAFLTFILILCLVINLGQVRSLYEQNICIECVTLCWWTGEHCVWFSFCSGGLINR
jgi:hypothetical protein